MRCAVIIVIALPGLAAAASSIETASYVTRSGVSSFIGEHSRWNEACRALDAPLVTLERAPGHGSICVRHDIIMPTQSRSGRAAHCISLRLNGVLVVYRPQQGFAGTDSLRYGLDFPEGHVSREIAIEIEPPTTAAPEFLRDGPTTELQVGARVPECAGESS